MTTALVAGSVIALIWAAARWERPEVRWIAWAVMIAWGFKLLMQDFPQGQAMSLFASLVVYGGTLILLSRAKAGMAAERASAAAAGQQPAG
jgi:hypothetical protein